MEDPSTVKYNHNNRYAVNASPLIANWDNNNNNNKSKQKKSLNNNNNSLNNTSSLANRKEYTPSSKYGVRSSSSSRNKRSTSSPPLKKKSEKENNTRIGKKKKMRKRPASASATRRRTTAGKHGSNNENNVWKSKRGVKEARRGAFSNITNKKSKRKRPSSAYARPVAVKNNYSKNTTTKKMSNETRRNIEELRMPQEPMTRKSAMAAKVTNTVLRSTRSTRSTKRPKSANVALASRKKKSTSHNNRYNSSSNNNNKHNNTNYNKYKNNRHEQQQRMNVRKSNANKAYLSSSNLSNNFRHNRPSSAPHHRRGNNNNNNNNNSNNNTPGQGSTSPTVATSILQSNYIKLTPLEKREKGWSARPADMAGGIPVYDASKDRYCPLYSPERHVIPGLKPQTHLMREEEDKKMIKRIRRKQKRLIKQQRKDINKNRTKLLDLRFEDEINDKNDEMKIHVVNANEIIKNEGSKNVNIQNNMHKLHAAQKQMAAHAMKEAKDALSPPRITFSTPTTESSKEVIVVKSILRREQTLQSLRDAVGRSKFNLKLVSALMERYREATVSTIEAVSQWSIGNEGAFMWHAKNYLLSIPSDLDALWHSKNMRKFLHFDIRRNPFVLPGIIVNGNNDNNKGNSTTIGNGDNVIPSDIKYYPGTDVNIEMRRLLDCERILLMEEEKYYDGSNNGSLLPPHWREVKSADYLMLRSAVFKDIQSSPALDDLLAGKTSSTVDDTNNNNDNNKLLPIKLPRAMEDSLNVGSNNVNVTQNNAENIEKEAWKQVLSSATTDNKSENSTTTVATATTTSTTTTGMNEGKLNGKEQNLKVRTTITPTKEASANRIKKTVSTPSQTSPEKNTISTMTPTNPVNPQWEDVKQRSPIMRKNTVWQEHFDPQNNCNWYYNTVTGESTWEKPKDWVDESWDQIQQRSPVTNMSGLWQQYYDPTYNCNWYYNTRTNQSTWEKPAGWSENGKNNGGKKKILKVAEKDEAKSVVPVLNLDQPKISTDVLPASSNTNTQQYVQERGNNSGKMLEQQQANNAATAFENDLKNMKKTREDRRIENDYRKLRRVHYEKSLDFNGSQWVEIFDPKTEAFYYWNQLSGEVQWEKPLVHIQANDDLFIRSALKIQSSYRGAKGRKYAKKTKQDKQQLNHQNIDNNINKNKKNMWVKAYDTANQTYYYYNSVTGEISLKKPDEVRVYNSPKLDLDVDEKNRRRQEVAAANDTSTNIIESSFHMKTDEQESSNKAAINDSFQFESPIKRNNEDDVTIFDDSNLFTNEDYVGGLSPEQRKLMDDVSNLRRQLQVAERELDFARYGYANPIMSSSAATATVAAKNSNSISRNDMSSTLPNAIVDDGKPIEFTSTRSSWNLSPVRSPEASIITRRSTSSPLSSSFAMVHELCADATHHAHALDVKYGHVLFKAEEERKAAAKIQNFYHRRYVNKNLAVEREKNNSAIKIQAEWRRKNEGNKLLKKQKSAVKLQSQMRRHIAVKKEIAKRDATVKIQAGVRGYKARRQTSKKRKQKQKRKKHEATVKIQAGLRGYKARRHTSNIRKQKRKRETQKATVKIQAGLRGYKARKEVNDLKNKRTAAIKLQSRARGMNERRQRALKNYAAIRIQAQWRRYITRETYLYVCQYRNDKAAIIQALCRGYFSRKNKFNYYKLINARKSQYDNIRKSPSPSKNNSRGYSSILGKINIDNDKNDQIYPTTDVNENDAFAATKLQASWRGYSDRKNKIPSQQQQEVINEDTADNYDYAEKVVMEDEEEEEEEEDVVIDSNVETTTAIEMSQEDIARVQTLATTTIQQWWRKILLKRQEEYLNQMMIESIQKDAVLKIQSTYRGMLGKKLFQEKRQEYEYQLWENLQHESATKLQASFRGYRDRRDVSMKQQEIIDNENYYKQNFAATKLQASFRGYRDRAAVEEHKRSILEKVLKEDNKRLEQDRSFAEIYGSTKIQALYRGHLARRFAWVFRTAAVRIQAWWRSIEPRHAYLSRRVVSSSLLVAEQLIGIEKAGGGRAQDADGNTALLLAVHAGSIRLVNTCLQWGFDPNRSNSFGETPLHVAAATRRIDIADILLNANADVAAIDSVDRAVIHNAAESGSFELVKDLFDRGSLLDMRDSEGLTPLQLAASRGFGDCVAFMVYSGADIHITDNRNETAVHKAAAIGAADVVHVLAEHDSDINLVNIQSHTALHLASKYGHGDCVKMLLGFASNPNLQDTKGDTPAHFAARGGFLACIAHLIEYDCDMNITNVAQRTPLQEAKLQGHDHVISYVENKLIEKQNLTANQSRYIPPEKFWESPQKKKQTDNEASYNSPVVQTLEDRVNILSIEELCEIIDNDGVDRVGITDIKKLRRLAVGILQRPVVQDDDHNYIIVTVPPGIFEGSSIAINVPSLGMAHVRVPQGCQPGDKFRFQIPGSNSNGQQSSPLDGSSTTSTSTSSEQSASGIISNNQYTGGNVYDGVANVEEEDSNSNIAYGGEYENDEGDNINNNQDEIVAVGDDDEYLL